MATQSRPFAVVTGASSGIGLELAKCCAQGGFDVLVVADEAQIQVAAGDVASFGTRVEHLQADLSTQQGVDELYSAIGGRPVAALLANAGRGLGRGFLEQDWRDIQRVIDTNVTGTLYLIQRIGRDMVAARSGRILITGSIAGFMPGTYQAVYNGTKALLDSFSFALRHEIKDSGVTVTCLMPGATETEFFERADMMDTKVGTDKKMSASDVAKVGYEAMMKGEGDVVAGWQNKLQAAIAHIMPAGALANMHESMAKPGTAKH